MIEPLLSLSLRGSLVYLLILGISRLSAKGTKCAGRRIWWLIAAVSFLIPNPFSRSFFAESWNYLHSEVPNVSSRSGEVASLVSMAGEAGQTVATPIITSLHTAPSIQWLPILWLAGAVISLGIVIIQTLITSRRWSRERLCTNTSILSLLEDCKMETGITAPIGLVISNRISAPALLGWLRPRIILPSNLVATFPPEQLRAILFHELAHFKWLDVPSNWLFVLVRAIHWFNPFAYLAAKDWTSFREEAADEAAMKWMGDGEGYGETLVAALRQNPGTDIPYGALAIGESLKNLKQRITLIGQYAEKKGRLLMVSFAALAVIALGLVLLPLGLYAAESPPPQFIRDVGTYHLSPKATLTIFTDPEDPTGYLQYKYNTVLDKKDWDDSEFKKNSPQPVFEANKCQEYEDSRMVHIGDPYFFYWDEKTKALWQATPNQVIKILLFRFPHTFVWQATSQFIIKQNSQFDDKNGGKAPQVFIDEVKRVFGSSVNLSQTAKPVVGPHEVHFGVIPIAAIGTNRFFTSLGNGNYCVGSSYVNADSNIVTSVAIEDAPPSALTNGVHPLVTFNAMTNPSGQSVKFSNGVYNITVTPKISSFPFGLDFGIVPISDTGTNHFERDLGGGKFCVGRSFVNPEGKVVTSVSIEVRGPEVIGGAQSLIKFDAKTSLPDHAITFSNGIYNITVTPHIQTPLAQKMARPVAAAANIDNEFAKTSATVPFQPLLIATPGTYTTSDGAWKVVVSNTALNLSHGEIAVSYPYPTGMIGIASNTGWTAHAGWFVFVESDSIVWAYDGNRLLMLFTSEGVGLGATVWSFISPHLPFPVTEFVYSRLSEPAKKMIDPHDLPVSK